MKVGEYQCACGGRVIVSEARGGTLSTRCHGACGQTGFIKSPNGVNAMRAKLGAPAEPAEPTADRDSFAKFIGAI